MNTNILKNLIGQKINAAQEIHDYFQLLFENGSILNINVGIDAENIKHIEHQTLINVVETCSAITFEFSNQVILNVDFESPDFSGPELLSLRGADGITVVWQ